MSTKYSQLNPDAKARKNNETSYNHFIFQAAPKPKYITPNKIKNLSHKKWFGVFVYEEK